MSLNSRLVGSSVFVPQIWDVLERNQGRILPKSLCFLRKSSLKDKDSDSLLLLWLMLRWNIITQHKFWLHYEQITSCHLQKKKVRSLFWNANAIRRSGRHMEFVDWNMQTDFLQFEGKSTPKSQWCRKISRHGAEMWLCSRGVFYSGSEAGDLHGAGQKHCPNDWNQMSVCQL